MIPESIITGAIMLLMGVIVSVLAWSIKELVAHGKVIAALETKTGMHEERLKDLGAIPEIVSALREAVETLKRAVERIGG